MGWPDIAELQSGYTDRGLPFVSGINCSDCGRFVGRDGSIVVEHFEMSSTVASVEGTCAKCLAAKSNPIPEGEGS